MRSSWIAVIGVCVLAGLVLTTNGCAKHFSDTGSVTMAKGEMMPMDQAAAPQGITGNSGYDSQYREPARAGEEYGATAPPAPGQPGSDQQYTPGAYSGQQFDLDSWFSPAAYAADTKPAEQYLIRNGDMSLNVESYDEAAEAVTATAEKFAGVVTDSNMEKAYDGTRSGFITVRVPGKDFFAAWAELLKIGEVLHQNTTSQDVSAQYVAAVSRLKNLTAEQATLQGMLADAREVQKTRGLGEAYKVLLDTQARLSDVTGELQATEDQIAQLADQITRSTIRVNLAEKAVYQSSEFTWGVGDTFKASWKAVLLGFKSTLNGIIAFLITSILWVPWVLLVIWLTRLAWGRWRKRRASGKAAG